MIQKIILCAFFYFIFSNIAMAEDSRGEFTDYLLELQTLFPKLYLKLP